MSLTELELERRRNFIGASEMPCILGISPFNNASDIYYFKTESIEPLKNEGAIEGGNLLEPTILKWASKELGQLHPGDWKVYGNGIIAATLDSTTAEGTPVEAKSTGIVGPGFPELWGDEYTDEVPEHVLCQVQVQMMCQNAEKCFVPALIGGRGFAMFIVKANLGMQDVIRKESEKFWNEHVLPRVPPENLAPSMETMKRMFRTEGKRSTVPSSLVEEFRLRRDIAKAAVEAKESAQARLIASLGDAEVGVFESLSGPQELTYRLQQRKGYTVEAAEFRVLRVK